MSRIRGLRFSLSAAAVVGAIAAVVVAAVVFGAPSGGGGEVPDLDVPQTASASDQGITLQARSAAFSATGTFISVTAEVSSYEARTGIKVVGLLAPNEAMSESTVLPVAVGAQSLPVGREAVIRLSPVVATGGSQQVVITALDVKDEAGETTRLNGRWVLPLALPQRLAEALRTEALRPLAPVADDRGIVFRGVSGIRSTTETLITVELESPAPLSPFAEPWFYGKGSERMFCRLVETKEGGRVYSYSCPPTPFEEKVSIAFLTLIDPSTSAELYTAKLDLAALMQRKGVSEQDGNSLSVSPADVATDDPAGSRILSITFGKVQRDFQTSKAINFLLRGNWEDPDALQLVSATGRSLDKRVVDSSYRKDAAGAITEGTTEVVFVYDDTKEIGGIVELSYGTATALVHGYWELTFEPVP